MINHNILNIGNTYDAEIKTSLLIKTNNDWVYIVAIQQM